MLSRRRFVQLIGALPFLSTASQARADQGGFYYKGPLSDHFDGQRFFNPGGERSRSFVDFLHWQLSKRAVAWPEAYPSPFQDTPPARVGKRDLRISLVGHATFLIQIAGHNILTDPIWSERASPVPFAGPRRYNRPGVPLDRLPRIDAVLISHGHYDHLDLPTLASLWKRDQPVIMAPLGNDAIIRAHDPSIAVTALDWGDRAEAVPGLEVIVEPAHHWSARATNDRNHALWASFVVRSGGRSVYFAGDTGFGGGLHFEAIAARHSDLDVALLPIGAYEPRWFMVPHHMNPDDAVRAFRILKAKSALGYHWGTFRLTDEGVDQPPRDLATALQAGGIPARRFIAMRPGQVWTA
ncbi:MBL fold metallo-hydrolase [Microvirga roseola]|uniref:MBL fold metallo-hydrolase n=1 Tax=Microvirga roseola TaxID=2883126 RepID=UPI001E45F90B|nr:MBL fold metallo-hydrolase [Microvirga roseola]